MNSINSILFILVFGLLSCTSKKEVKAEEVKYEVVKTDIKVLTTYDQLKQIYSSGTDTVYVINFWATWCKPCVAELPYFNEVSNELKGKKLKFLFVSMDFVDSIDKLLKPFLVKRHLNGNVMVMADQDVNSWGSEIDPKWDGAIPVTIMVKNGKKESRLGSFKDKTDLMNFINQYL